MSLEKHERGTTSIHNERYYCEVTKNRSLICGRYLYIFFYNKEIHASKLSFHSQPHTYTVLNFHSLSLHFRVDILQLLIKGVEPCLELLDAHLLAHILCPAGSLGRNEDRAHNVDDPIFGDAVLYSHVAEPIDLDVDKASKPRKVNAQTLVLE